MKIYYKNLVIEANSTEEAVKIAKALEDKVVRVLPSIKSNTSLTDTLNKKYNKKSFSTKVYWKKNEIEAVLYNSTLSPKKLKSKFVCLENHTLPAISAMKSRLNTWKNGKSSHQLSKKVLNILMKIQGDNQNPVGEYEDKTHGFVKERVDEVPF